MAGRGKAKNKQRGQSNPRPDGDVRRSQLLTTYGPGSLVDLVEHAVVIGGLDQWRYAHPGAGMLSEPRLTANLGRVLKQMSWWPKGSTVRLREPPGCDNDHPTFNRGIGSRVFPRWFMCQNNQCGSLVHETTVPNGRHACNHTIGKRGRPVVPVRFIAGCPHGHVQDIDWNWFVHAGLPRNVEADPKRKNRFCEAKGASKKPNDPLGASYADPLYLHMVGTSGELTDIIVGCRNCGETRSLGDLQNPASLGKCWGNRPWLKDSEDCPDPDALKLMTRTASNTYFPQLQSVLSIPDAALLVNEAVEKVWTFLQGVETLEDLRTFRKNPVLKKALVNEQGIAIADHLVLDAVLARAKGKTPSLPPPRSSEWWAFLKAPIEQPGEVAPRGERWFARRALTPDLPPFIDRVVLAHNLTEVRAQFAFTRLDSPTPDAEGEVELSQVHLAPLADHAREDLRWVPAVEIFGEGVFIAFDLDAVRNWEALPPVKAREAQFKEAFEQYNKNQTKATRQVTFPGARLLMLHTLAHLLIQAIGLEAGYPATALRERIYCYRGDNQADDRAGILIYTGTPGTEGTLGGLIEAGRGIKRHLRRACELAMLCSNDPVCAQHEPETTEEDRLRHGAACHGCLLISEPSCERMNRDLDRALVVPTVEHADMAFLADWIASWHSSS
jgi:hypothetical protein